jgi:hypothetical protein
MKWVLLSMFMVLGMLTPVIATELQLPLVAKQITIDGMPTIGHPGIPYLGTPSNPEIQIGYTAHQVSEGSYNYEIYATENGITNVFDDVAIWWDDKFIFARDGDATIYGVFNTEIPCFTALSLYVNNTIVPIIESPYYYCYNWEVGIKNCFGPGYFIFPESGFYNPIKIFWYDTMSVQQIFDYKLEDIIWDLAGTGGYIDGITGVIPYQNGLELEVRKYFETVSPKFEIFWVSTQEVPEPATLSLLALGVLAIRKRK